VNECIRQTRNDCNKLTSKSAGISRLECDMIWYTIYTHPFYIYMYVYMYITKKQNIHYIYTLYIYVHIHMYMYNHIYIYPYTDTICWLSAICWLSESIPESIQQNRDTTSENGSKTDIFCEMSMTVPDHNDSECSFGPLVCLNGMVFFMTGCLLNPGLVLLSSSIRGFPST